MTMVLRHSIEKRSISKLHDCFSDWDFTKERLHIWNFWTIFKIDGPLVSEKKHPNTQVTGSKGFQNGHHVSIFVEVRTLLNLSEFCFCQIQPPGASRRVDESKCSGGETEKQIAGELPGYKLWYIGLNYRMDYSFWKKENIADKEMIMLSFPFCVNAHVRRESTCLKSWYWTCRRDVVRLIRRWNILLKLFFRVEFMFAM